jgi:pyroglutamyl-peptidase
LPVCRTARRPTFSDAWTGPPSAASRSGLSRSPYRAPDCPASSATSWRSIARIFYVSLGLALGAPAIRLETTAINRTDFGVADNDGARPTGGGPIDPEGPPARFATWDAGALVKELLSNDIPAVVSHHAGTHLCNLVLYYRQSAPWPAPGCRRRSGSCIVPYTPLQVARFLRDGPPEGDLAPTDAAGALPSMPTSETQEAALRLALARAGRV